VALILGCLKGPQALMAIVGWTPHDSFVWWFSGCYRVFELYDISELSEFSEPSELSIKASWMSPSLR